VNILQVLYPILLELHAVQGWHSSLQLDSKEHDTSKYRRLKIYFLLIAQVFTTTASLGNSRYCIAVEGTESLQSACFSACLFLFDQSDTIFLALSLSLSKPKSPISSMSDQKAWNNQFKSLYNCSYSSKSNAFFK